MTNIEYNRKMALIATITRGWVKASNEQKIKVIEKWGPLYKFTKEEIQMAKIELSK